MAWLPDEPSKPCSYKYELESKLLKRRFYKGFIWGTAKGLIKGDTRRLDDG